MTNTSLFTRRTLAVAVAAALTFYVGSVPQDGLWEEGMSSAGVVFAAGRKGGGSGGSHSSGHDDSDHSHDDSDHSHDDSDTDHDHDTDDGHSSGKKGFGPKYYGGRSASGSTKGRGEGSRAVVLQVFEKDIKND